MSSVTFNRVVPLWQILEKTFNFDADWGWLLSRSVYAAFKASLNGGEEVSPHPLVKDFETLSFLFSKMTDSTGLAISGNRLDFLK